MSTSDTAPGTGARGATPQRNGTGPRVVSIALVNDHELVVRGLQRMLEDFKDRVDVVELDVNTDVATPVDVALYDTFSVTQVTDSDIDDVIAEERVGAVAVYTWNMQPELVEAALGKGVRGYLSKTLAGADLVAAIERVAAGEQVVLPTEELGEEAEVATGDWPGRQEGLSARQAEVVALITQGLSNQEIAQRTYLSPNTVKSYIREAYRTMGVTSRTQAVLWGIQHGMLPARARVLTGKPLSDLRADEHPGVRSGVQTGTNGLRAVDGLAAEDAS